MSSNDLENYIDSHALNKSPPVCENVSPSAQDDILWSTNIYILWLYDKT